MHLYCGEVQLDVKGKQGPIPKFKLSQKESKRGRREKPLPKAQEHRYMSPCIHYHLTQMSSFVFQSRVSPPGWTAVCQVRSMTTGKSSSRLDPVEI